MNCRARRKLRKDTAKAWRFGFGRALIRLSHTILETYHFPGFKTNQLFILASSCGIHERLYFQEIRRILNAMISCKNCGGENFQISFSKAENPKNTKLRDLKPNYISFCCATPNCGRVYIYECAIDFASEFVRVRESKNSASANSESETQIWLEMREEINAQKRK